MNKRSGQIKRFTKGEAKIKMKKIDQLCKERNENVENSDAMIRKNDRDWIVSEFLRARQESERDNTVKRKLKVDLGEKLDKWMQMQSVESKIWAKMKIK